MRRSSLRGLTAGLATALLAALVTALPATAAPSDTPAPDLTHARAQWIDRDTLAWHIDAPAGATENLLYAPDGGITVDGGRLTGDAHTLHLHPVPGGLTAAQRTRFPQLSG